MAEERNTGLTTTTGGGAATTRAEEATTSEFPTSDTEETKEELQRRMDEARESISQTVADIKDNVTTQYNNVRESINDTLDWREQYRRRPVPFSLGALGFGLLVGYSLTGAFKGGNDDYDETEYEYDESDYSDDYTPTMATRTVRRDSGASNKVGSARLNAPSYMRSESSSGAEITEPSGPGIFERFKGTQAYDKLTSEVGTLGNRVVDELSHTAQAVVLPMLLGKVKDLIGIDLGTQREVAERSHLEQQSSNAKSEAVKAENKQQAQHDQKNQDNAHS